MFDIVGIIYPKVNFLLALICCMLYSAAFMCYIPHITSAPILLAIFVINQIGMGALESGSNMFILHLWGKETTPFMQALHFMFGAGSLISPLIAVPFLVEKDEDVDLHPNDAGNHTTTGEVFHPEDINLVPPYCIIAAALVANAVFGFVVWRLFPETPAHPSREVANESSRNSVEKGVVKTSECHPLTNHYQAWKIAVIILTLCFMHIYLGLEISFGSFMTTFAVKSGLGLSKADGAHLTTMFWSTFTLFRIMTVFYLDIVGLELNIFASMLVILIANAFLIPFGSTSVPMLWAGCAIIGVGISSVWACVYGFLEEHFTLSPIVSALMIVAAVLGEFVFPVVISSFIDEYPMVLMWVTLFCSIGCSAVFTLMSLICRFKLGKLER
jgi:FHS family Na+ dependent glucose MFS transporter 1